MSGVASAGADAILDAGAAPVLTELLLVKLGRENSSFGFFFIHFTTARSTVK